MRHSPQRSHVVAHRTIRASLAPVGRALFNQPHSGLITRCKRQQMPPLAGVGFLVRCRGWGLGVQKAKPKLFKLKEWVSVESAAEILSNTFEETVTRADIFQLAYEGQLVLSVNYPAYINAYSGEVKDFDPSLLKDLPNIDGGTPKKWLDGIYLDEAENKVVVWDRSRVRRLTGLWDLSMRGAESLDVQHEMLTALREPSPTLINLDGTILKNQDGSQWAYLLDEFDKENQPRDPVNKYFPAGGLIGDYVYAIRATELSRMLDAATRPQQPPEPDKELSTRERNSLLRAIAGLVSLMLGKTNTGKKHSVFESQAAIITALEAHFPNKEGIKKNTLEQKIAEGKNLLDN